MCLTFHVYIRGFPGGTRGKESACQCRRHKETWVWSLGWEDLLEKEVTTHSSIPAWRIPWTEEPGGLQFMGSQRVGHDWSDWASKYIHSDPVYFNCYTELHYRNKLQSIFFFFFIICFPCCCQKAFEFFLIMMQLISIYLFSFVHLGEFIKDIKVIFPPSLYFCDQTNF